MVAQTLHLEQVTNNSFRNHFGSFFSDSLSTVLGSMSILLYGVIASNGLKVLIKERVDFAQMRNLIIASVMSALEGMMGQGGMPDLSALGGAGMPDMSQMFGGGLKGKIGEFAMKQSMKRMANKMKKAKKKRK